MRILCLIYELSYIFQINFILGCVENSRLSGGSVCFVVSTTGIRIYPTESDDRIPFIWITRIHTISCAHSIGTISGRREVYGKFCSDLDFGYRLKSAARGRRPNFVQEVL